MVVKSTKVKVRRPVNNDLRQLARQFQIHNRAENKSEKTIAWYDASIQRFCRFVEDGKTKTWSLERLKPPRVEQNLKNVLTEAELRVVFESFNPECFLGARNLAMVALLLDGGLRAGELTDLKLKDCDLEVGFVKVNCPNLFVTYEGTDLQCGPELLSQTKKAVGVR